MKQILFLIFLFSADFCWAFSSSQEMTLTVGESYFVKADSPVWVENGKVVHVGDHQKNLAIKALHPGISELRVGKQHYIINVLSIKQAQTVSLLQSELKKFLNLKLQIVNAEVLVTGRIQSWNDWKKLANICFKKNCYYEFRAEMDNEVFYRSEKNILSTLGNFKLPKLKIEKSEGYFLKIPEKVPYFKKLEEALSAYGIHVQSDASSIEVAPLVKVQITIAEVKRDFLNRFGMKWPVSYTTNILPETMAGGDRAVSSAVNLQALETNGTGKVLASPNILCCSGKEAEFLAGGEFPIKIFNLHMQEVAWKRYGILLKVKPLADYNGRMSISIETEVSSIDPARSIDGIPALFTNRVQSHFDLLQPRTIALSGLIKNETSQNTEGLPWISRVPILGALFSSKEFRDNKTELVIFVRPEIIPADADDQEMKLPEANI